MSSEAALGTTAVDATRGPKDAVVCRCLLAAGALHHTCHVATVETFSTQLFTYCCLLLSLLAASDFHLLGQCRACLDGPRRVRGSTRCMLLLLVLRHALLD